MVSLPHHSAAQNICQTHCLLLNGRQRNFTQVNGDYFSMSAIHDVAKRAGVAPITVSRVVNNNGYVSEETRRRVEAAILELDYVPNALGSSLRSKRTQTLALVLS